MKRRMLFIAMCLPFNKAFHAGGKTFNYYIQKFAQDDCEVKLIAKVLPDEEPYLDSILPEIEVYPVATPKSKAARLLAYGKSLNSKINPWYPYGNTLTKEIYDQIHRRLTALKNTGYRPDVVVLEWTAMLLYIDRVKEVFPDAVYVASEHDVTFLGYERRAADGRSPLKRLYRTAAYRSMKRHELQSIEKCDLVVTHNEKDKRLLLQNGVDEGKLGVIAPYYDKFPFINRCSNDRDILFYGAMNRVENYSSAIWFIESVLPLLRERDVRFIVIGNKPPKELLERQNDRVVVTGFVDDPAPYFESAACLVAPLLLGAGVKVKIIEALSSGVPVLTNEIGIEGIDAEDRRDYFLCRKPEEYAAVIGDILSGKLDTASISANAHALIEEKYDLEKSYNRYKDRIMRLVEHGE